MDWIYHLFFFSSRRRHTSLQGDWSSDVCSSDLGRTIGRPGRVEGRPQQVVRLHAIAGATEPRHRVDAGVEQRAEERGRSEERRVGKERMARRAREWKKESIGRGGEFR